MSTLADKQSVASPRQVARKLSRYRAGKVSERGPLLSAIAAARQVNHSLTMFAARMGPRAPIYGDSNERR